MPSTANGVGARHCAMNMLYSLQHLGYVIPPQNGFTDRNTTFMTWNLMRLARMFKTQGGIPAHGHQRSAWDAGSRFDVENPEYRGVSAGYLVGQASWRLRNHTTRQVLRWEE